MTKKRFAGKLGIIFFLITFLFVTASSFFYENKTLYTNFVDEEDNMVSAKYILSGQRLYKDIFAQHQPLTYLISAGLEKAFNPDSIFLLIKRHREFVIGWSAVWMFVIAYSFGWVGLGFVIIYELTKHFLFGNLFLAEAFTVYPLVFLVGRMILFRKSAVKLPEIFFYGVCFSFLVFTLAPTWPLLIFLLLVFILKRRGVTLKEFFSFAAGFLSVVCLILPFISIRGYIQDIIYFNSKYGIPLNQEQLNFTSIIKSFLSFLLAFANGLEKTPILTIIRTMSLVFTTGLIFLAKKRKFLLLSTLLVILGLANIRYIQPGLDFYRGFHLLPWFAVIVLFVCYIFAAILHDKQKIFLAVSVILSVGLAAAIISPDINTLFLKRNLSDDYYIFFSGHFDMGTAVSIMKKGTDTLFVYPDQSLIYWQAGIAKASPYIYFYPFMENIPSTFNYVSQMFEKTPPTYFYCICDGSKLTKYLKMYTPLAKNGKTTQLYILNSRISTITKEQRKQLLFYNFNIPK